MAFLCNRILVPALWLLGTGTLCLLGVSGSKLQAAEAAQKRILVLTGEDYPGHKWQETTPVVKEQLAKDDRWVVEVIDDLKWVRDGQLDKYDAVVLHFKNYDPEVPGPAGQGNLERYVREGGGLVLLHFACGAFQEWPEFVNVAGRVWNPQMRAHDPHGTFRVEITDSEHPITKGLAGFETTDELYTCLDGTVPIRVLAESESKVDQKRYAMAFVLEVGKGRVFHTPLGHDPVAFRPDPVGELLRRGTAWAAGLPPTK